VACSWRFEITERALTERRGTPDRTTRDEENGLSGERKSRINQSSAGEQENKKEPGNRDLAIAGSHSFGGKTKDRTLRQNRTDGQIHGTRAGIDDLHQKSARGKKKSGTWAPPLLGNPRPGRLAREQKPDGQSTEARKNQLLRLPPDVIGNKKNQLLGLSSAH
jgi:hypothetical protein